MMTIIDTQKQNADILVEYANGGSFTIINQTGVEIKGRGVKKVYENGSIEVTTNKLNKLREKFNVITNF